MNKKTDIQSGKTIIFVAFLVQESIFIQLHLTSKGVSKLRITVVSAGVVMTQVQSSLFPYSFGKLGDCICPDSALICPPHPSAAGNKLKKKFGLR